MNYQDLNNIDDIQFIPVNNKKIPIVKEWQHLSKKHNISDCYGVGIVCGKLSGGLEAIDVDLKYDLTGKLFDRYKRLVNEIDNTLLPKLVVQKTQSGGYHLLYRCGIISGNLKLANRPTTDAERNDTYKKTYEAELIKNPDDVRAREIAEKAKNSDKVRVLFETRGEGGYIMCFPSKGYELIHGDFYGINEITPEQREILHSTARQFNEVQEEYSPKIKKEKIKGTSPFDDYNNRGDVVALLEKHGWRIVSQKGGKTIFLRPGQTTSSSSGNFDHDKNWFSVFTTSSEFEPMTAYMPYAVFAILECNKDFSEASRRLYDMGYGDRKDEKKPEQKSTRIIYSRIDTEQKDMSAFATPQDYNDYLQSVRDGTLVMGKTTGCPSLDEYFVFKEGNLVMLNGLDNVGKSEFVWWINMIAAMYHGWRGVIFASENTIGTFMRRMIQFYWGKPLAGSYAMSQAEFDIAKTFVEKHFKIIKAQETLYNYKDIINLCKIAMSEAKFNYAMIDPYNSLKTDLSGFSKLNTHEYHYEAVSEIKAFGQTNSFGFFINHHAVTAAIRMRDADKKYPVAPRKEDTEGGGKMANKTDDFLTVHRITNHPTEWMITEIHVRKIKDTETGGRPTPIDSPVKFERYKGGYAYCEWLEGGQRGEDPIANWHSKKKPEQKNIGYSPKPTWTPYAGDKESDINF